MRPINHARNLEPEASHTRLLRRQARSTFDLAESALILSKTLPARLRALHPPSPTLESLQLVHAVSTRLNQLFCSPYLGVSWLTPSDPVRCRSRGLERHRQLPDDIGRLGLHFFSGDRASTLLTAVSEMQLWVRGRWHAGPAGKCSLTGVNGGTSKSRRSAPRRLCFRELSRDIATGITIWLLMNLGRTGYVLSVSAG